MDCDFSHDPADVARLIAACEDGADLALGSRWVDGGGTVNWGLLRRVISRGGSLYARLVLGVSVRDLTGGFKCFRREVLETIDLDAIAARGYGFQIEGTYRALRAGFRVVEIPITFVDRRVGESKMSGAIVLEAMRQVPGPPLEGARGGCDRDDRRDVRGRTCSGPPSRCSSSSRRPGAARARRSSRSSPTSSASTRAGSASCSSTSRRTWRRPRRYGVLSPSRR